MKKNVIFSLMAAMLFGFAMMFSSCNSCNRTEEPVVEPVTEEQPVNLVVDSIVAVDFEAVHELVDGSDDFRWYECGVVLQDYLDEECDGTVVEVGNVFQTVVERENGFDTYVIMTTHDTDTAYVNIVKSFWIEDFPLNNDIVTLISFDAAFERLMEANCPKPHSKRAVLRKEIGPKQCNPQWIFGNLESTVYVDAVTGEVRDFDPAFEGITLETPLGEWP